MTTERVWLTEFEGMQGVATHARGGAAHGAKVSDREVEGQVVPDSTGGGGGGHAPARQRPWLCSERQMAGASLSSTLFCVFVVLLCQWHVAGAPFSGTVAPVMFGKPLLNNVLSFDHVQLQK